MSPNKETHRFTGMWRPTIEEVDKKVSEEQRGSSRVSCTCGAISYIELRDHWLKGHFDIPQYEEKVMTPDWRTELALLFKELANLVKVCTKIIKKGK